MEESRRNDIVNAGLDRIDEMLFQALDLHGPGRAGVSLLRHLMGGLIHRKLVDNPALGNRNAGA